jgi:serine phosphatase RsbU (regulator of sigma subunit)/anti-sigma regulatory factor (Ser/Thr protein kinase)
MPSRSSGRLELQILDDLPNVAWAHDANGITHFLNARYRQYAGVDRPGIDWLETAHPEDRPRCVAAWEGARSLGQSFEVEYRIRRADETYRWHLVRAQRARPIENEPALWLLTATDIEETRQAREQLEYINAASRLLAASLDAPATINELLDLVRPRFADCALVDTFDEDGAFLERYVRGEDRIVALLQHELDFRLRFANRRLGSWTVLETGRPRLQSFADGTSLRALALNEEHYALLRELAPTSVLSLPLRVGGRTIGVIALVSTSPGRLYTERDVAFFQDLAARTSVAIGNAQAYVREHRIATRLQRAMLPERLPQVEGIRLDAAYLPSDEELLIGGDWYDAFVLPGERLAVSIGDVAGHGLEAAITMSQLRHALRVAALDVEEPGDVLTAANRALALGDDLKLATAFFAIIDRRSLRMQYANAGHPPPAIVDAGGHAHELSFGELPLGIDGDGAYDTHTIVLQPGALAVFYTDGLIENQHDLQQGARELYDAIRLERDAHPVRLARRIVGRVLSASNADDIAILTMLIEAIPVTLQAERGSVRWAFQADDASAAHETRTALLTYLRARGSEDSDFDAAELIFGELVGNVVKHAPGPITIELVWDRETPTLRVADRGPGFELRPALPEDLMSEGGRGLFLAATYGTDLRVTRSPEGGSRVSATLPVRRG